MPLRRKGCSFSFLIVVSLLPPHETPEKIKPNAASERKIDFSFIITYLLKIRNNIKLQSYETLKTILNSSENILLLENRFVVK